MNILQKNIVDKIKHGDISAFEKVFRDLYAPLCAYANKIINDKDKAEELVQEIFYVIWKKKAQLTISVSLKSYLYKSVQNSCFQLAQHQMVKDKYKQYVVNRKEESYNSPDKELEMKEINLAIDKTLDGLPERCKTIFQMSRFEGLKYREIAEQLSISQKTVEANISKALRQLRKNLKQYANS